MRCLGLDLGTKTLGLAISDKSNMIASPYKVLRWDGEDYIIIFFLMIWILLLKKMKLLIWFWACLKT